ncbi:parvo_NS1 domain-containing protein [Trichonephila clavipes]|uniref:Parvo_NS1 domain-containing protein n=1 Tax=Trichonephila clavipes TaxID=2585209 RepID=A0A8X6VJ93_TRICX|nr:parvo_NS1 domain-containing protein [Trichonephila clavipes]
MDTQFSYRAIVFGLKPGKTFDESLQIKKKLKLRTVIISEHPEGDDNCEYQCLHCHGMVEHSEKYRFDSDRIFNEIKTLCTFFKSELKLPVNFAAYLKLEPRTMIFINELEGSDLTCILSQITEELLEQVVFDKPYQDLCVEYNNDKNQCMSPYNSADIMDQWCKFQGIDPFEFAVTIRDLMDQKHRKLNTVILEGEPNSGKTYIAKSLTKACIFYGDVSTAVAGYGFMWQDSVNKRMILINEPFFDRRCVEELKTILEGTKTFVKVKGKGDEYLRPTPCMITTNMPVWIQCPTAEKAILARTLKYYKNLKACPFLKQVTKDLHPRWLGLLLIRYAKTCIPVYFSDSDDECTPPAIDTVAPVLTSLNKIKLEDRGTNLTDFAGNTTSTSPPWAPKKLIKDSTRQRLRLAGLETSSPNLSQSKVQSEDYQGHSTCLGKETPRNLSKSLKRLLSRSPDHKKDQAKLIHTIKPDQHQSILKKTSPEISKPAEIWHQNNLEQNLQRSQSPSLLEGLSPK